jgi:hypothetical protein
MLSGYVVSDLFMRAGSPGGGSLSLAEFRALVLTDAATLATALGERSGIPLGETAWLPDVERSRPLQELVGALAPERVPDRVRTCAITGLSGIGKSSLVAAYAHEYADAYDFVGVDRRFQRRVHSGIRRTSSCRGGHRVGDES